MPSDPTLVINVSLNMHKHFKLWHEDNILRILQGYILCVECTTDPIERPYFYTTENLEEIRNVGLLKWLNVAIVMSQ